jgi:hypothetical protein
VRLDVRWGPAEIPEDSETIWTTPPCISYSKDFYVPFVIVEK